MYPETDIPPVQIKEDFVSKLKTNMPEFPEQKMQRFMKEYKINPKLAKQVLDSEYAELFEVIVEESGVLPTTVAVFLTEALKALKREGVPIETVKMEKMKEMFVHIGSGKLTREAAPEVFSWLSQHQDGSVEEAVSAIGLKMLSKEEIETIVDRVINGNKSLVERQSGNAFGAIMGLVMKEVRGKANAEIVAEIVKERLKVR